LLPFGELGKTNSFLMSLFPTLIMKKILGKNVAFTSFVGRMDAAECTALALEEKCDDLVGATSGSLGLECDEGFIVLAS